MTDPVSAASSDPDPDADQSPAEGAQSGVPAGTQRGAPEGRLCAQIDPAALARLRGAHPDCETVLLIALGPGTVLARDSALRLPQDDLEALAAEAQAVFSGCGPDVRQAILHRPTGTRLFLRAGPAEEDAICAVLPPSATLLSEVAPEIDAELAPIIAAAFALLDGLPPGQSPGLPDGAKG